MFVIAVFLVLVLGASVHGLRAPRGGPRWPFLVASTLSGGAILALLIARVIAVTAGRDTWNSWVSGSQSSETITLWLVLIVLPVLLATCCGLLIVGAVLRTRQRRRSEEGIISVPPDGDPRRTSDLATRDDSTGSVGTARGSDQLPTDPGAR